MFTNIFPYARGRPAGAQGARSRLAGAAERCAGAILGQKLVGVAPRRVYLLIWGPTLAETYIIPGPEWISRARAARAKRARCTASLHPSALRAPLGPKNSGGSDPPEFFKVPWATSRAFWRAGGTRKYHWRPRILQIQLRFSLLSRRGRPFARARTSPPPLGSTCAE